MNNSIDRHCKEVDKNETAGQKRGRDLGAELTTSGTAPSDTSPVRVMKEHSSIQNLSIARSLHDLAVLDFVSKEFWRENLVAEKEKNFDYPDGVVVEVWMKKRIVCYSSRGGRLGSSLVLFGTYRFEYNCVSTSRRDRTRDDSQYAPPIRNQGE